MFFDVDVSGQRNTPDSFFDIFIDPVTGAARDSFFDIFVELDQRDRSVQTEILSMNLRSVDPSTGNLPDSFFDVFVDLGELQAEQDARIAADEALQSSLDSEAQARIAADESLQNNLNAEISDRQAADDALQDNLNSHIAADGDLDDTNEIQSLSLSGQVLSISDGNTVTLPSSSDKQRIIVQAHTDLFGSPSEFLDVDIFHFKLKETMLVEEVQVSTSGLVGDVRISLEMDQTAIHAVTPIFPGDSFVVDSSVFAVFPAGSVLSVNAITLPGTSVNDLTVTLLLQYE